MHAMALHIHFALGPSGHPRRRVQRSRQLEIGIERCTKCMKCNSALASSAFLGDGGQPQSLPAGFVRALPWGYLTLRAGQGWYSWYYQHWYGLGSKSLLS